MERDILRHIGALIKKRRQAIGITAEKLGEKMQLTRATITKIETGRQGVSAVQLWKIACWLECQPENLLPRVQAEEDMNISESLKRVNLDKLPEKEREWIRALKTTNA